MITLLQKLAEKLLEKVENAAVSIGSLHETGMLPFDVNYFIPMPYIYYWESRYIASIINMKEFETPETL